MKSTAFLDLFFAFFAHIISFVVELNQNGNKTTIHLKVIHAIQQKVPSNVNKLTEKKLKERLKKCLKTNPFSFFKPLSRLI